MQKILLLALCVLLAKTIAQNTEPIECSYEFSGKHFLASYLHCDQESLCDLEKLIEAMDIAVSASGATTLEKSSFTFPPHGLTIVYLLSESHASLHTYPEHGSCFVDLFTCGDNCSAQAFDKALRAYLHPKEVDAHYLKRDEKTKEIAYLLE